jgi:endonuclease/exonuclease/phosphatase family metal-dependent hydrolase
MRRAHRALLLLCAACGGSDDPGLPVADAAPEAAAPDAGDASVSEPDASLPAAPLRMDGLFDDWAGVEPLAQDPAGDASGAFDVTVLRARSEGTRLALWFDVGARRNLVEGEAADGTLGLDLVLPGGRHLTIDHRALDPRLDGRALIWEELAYEAAPTHSSTEFELVMDLALVGVATGDEVTIDFSGSDQLSEPTSFVLEGSAPEVLRRSTARRQGTTVRLASLNVLQSGVLPGRRRDPIVRLLRAADADVYCLQEEYDLTEEELVTLFEEVADATWHIYKVRDNVVASRYPLTGVPGRHDRYAAAVVEIPGAGPLVVVGVHLSCCGWDGNVDDRLRIHEADGIVETIEDLRVSGDPSTAEAPLVVVGDWNLVGSKGPLDILLDPEALGLAHWLLPQLVGEHVMTWHSSSSYFPPGILDLVVHTPEALVRQNGFVLEEARLSDEERAALGLEPEDGLATDHLLVVADFALP